ncbi:penicillin-binding protein 2 [Actinobacillus equuli]|nr:penicillin-binding protein 2 [Actinobacillus equuli]
MGLAEGKITPYGAIYDPGFWVLPGTTQRYRDWKKGGHGSTNVNKAIAESSDTFFYQLAYDTGIEKCRNGCVNSVLGRKRGLIF